MVLSQTVRFPVASVILCLHAAESEFANVVEIYVLLSTSL